MQQSLFFPKFDKIKHFNTLNFAYPQANLLPQGVENIKDIMEPTQAAVTENQKYQARSLKIIADPLDISFQQEFMDQHRRCFVKQLQKYMEHQTNLLQPNNRERSNKRSDDYDNDMSDLFTLPQMVREYGTSLSQEQRQMFIIDLKRQDKLSEFLEFVLNKVKDDSIKEIIHLVNQFWEEYILIQDMNYSLQQSLEFSEAFVSKHFEKLDDKLININFKSLFQHSQNRNGSSQNKERMSVFKKFLTFFTTTICLVIGGFFENPYNQTQQNYYKRELKVLNQDDQDGQDFNDESDEDDDEGVLNKRVKS